MGISAEGLSSRKTPVLLVHLNLGGLEVKSWRQMREVRRMKPASRILSAPKIIARPGQFTHLVRFHREVNHLWRTTKQVFERWELVITVRIVPRETGTTLREWWYFRVVRQACGWLVEEAAVHYDGIARV